MDDDLFLDESRLKKMIALGIYDDNKVAQMQIMKNRDFKGDRHDRPATMTTSSAAPASATRPDPPSAPPKPAHPALDSPFLRAQHGLSGPAPLTGQAADRWRPPNKTHGFKPLQNSSYKWQQIKESEPMAGGQKRPRSPSPNRRNGGRGRADFRDGIRDGIREGIQNRIQRNEIERKLNIDYMNDRPSGNSSADTDLRPKADTDSRLRDTDFRPVPNQATPTRRRNNNLSLTNPTAVDQDLRRRDGDRDERPGPHRPYNRGRGFGQRGGHSTGRPNPSTADPLDDIDQFIANASLRLDIKKPSPQKGRGGYVGAGRGRGADRRPNPPQRPDNSYSRPSNAFQSRQSNEPPVRRLDDQFDSAEPPMDDNVNADDDDEDPEPKSSSKHIAILRETVEELSKSNLFCQYCNIYLSSLVEVNTHIGTVSHQQNMAKKVVDENRHTRAPVPDPKVSFDRKSIDRAPPARPAVQTMIERVPTGMGVLVDMIEKRKQISLKSLTEMDSYEIRSESEASLAKELAKLLTNELLHYKMNIMPDTVKEALKHQGIGLLGGVSNN